MFIKNNHIANKLYSPYLKSIRNLEKSARVLATGEKYPTVADGGGELGVADRWKQKIKTTEKLIVGLEDTSGYLDTQGELLTQASEILQRMSELASSALDTTKNTNDRIALDAEFQALEAEMAQLAGRQYNQISLFGHVLSVRYDTTSVAGAAQTATLSAINLGNITFANLTLSQLASASAAFISIKSRVNSLNIFKSYAGNNSNEIDRIMNFTQTHINNLSNAENSIRDIDLALATGNFTKEQVILAAAQSAMAQSNGLIQSALAFLT